MSRQSGSPNYRRRRLLRLSGEQNHRCCYCGTEVAFWRIWIRGGGNLLPDDPTIEHLVPIAEGGHKSSWENQAMACFRCNNLRGSQDPVEFFEERRWEVKYSTGPAAPKIKDIWRN